MPVSASFLEQLRDTLGFVVELRTRRMFGGVGIYAGELMFALAIDDGLYLKTDAQTLPLFQAQGLEPFRFRDGKGVVREMSYRQAPDDLWEDPDVAREWADRALSAARRKA